MDCSPPGSSVHGVLQARILEWVALLQGIFLTQRLNPCVLCWQGSSLPLSCWESLMMPFWVVPHCSFDLHFSNNEQCWTSFHVFVGCLYVFFGEMSVLGLLPIFFIFCLLFFFFLYWLVQGQEGWLRAGPGEGQEISGPWSPAGSSHPYLWTSTWFGGLPGGSDSKESACNVGDLGLIPGLGRSPWEGNGQPTSVFWPGESHG